MPARTAPLSLTPMPLDGPAELPRKRLLRRGAEALTDEELLSIIIGGAGRARDALNRASRLLATHGVRGLCGADPSDLSQLDDMGPTASANVFAALELARRAQRPDHRPRLVTPVAIYEYLAPSLAGLRREVFHVLCLNSRNTLLRDIRVAEGTTTMCAVDPREVFAPALASRAAGIIVAHNHPSGDPTPSSPDVRLTRQLVKGAEVLGLNILDHIIIGETFFSFLERGLLHPMRGNAMAIAE